MAKTKNYWLDIERGPCTMTFPSCLPDHESLVLDCAKMHLDHFVCALTAAELDQVVENLGPRLVSWSLV